MARGEINCVVPTITISLLLALSAPSHQRLLDAFWTTIIANLLIECIVWVEQDQLSSITCPCLLHSQAAGKLLDIIVKLLQNVASTLFGDL